LQERLLMQAIIVIGVLVAACVFAGFFMYRSSKAAGGCACGCKVTGRKHDHAEEHAESCCKE
jgi:flagellar basal body-associated protein FliL